jgi:proteic killer suppression protein
MVIKFEKEYLQELYETGKTTDKQYRFQPEVAAQYQLRVDTLEGAENVETLGSICSLHYGVVKGDKRGIVSVHLNDEYRIVFRTTLMLTKTVATICDIIELSNPYK